MSFEVCASSPAEDAAPALAGPPPGPPRFDLGGLLARVQSAVRSGVPRQAWVACSVVKVHRRKNGYALALGENDASHSPWGGRLDAFLFEKDLASVREKMGMPDFDPADLENASAVLLLSLSFHARFHLQAVVQDINPALGHSVLTKHISRIRERLRAEGLLDRQARLPKPGDIQRLAVVHPVGAAGWADVSRELKRPNPSQ
jgi:exonuclease VII large subunit